MYRLVVSEKGLNILISPEKGLIRKSYFMCCVRDLYGNPDGGWWIEFYPGKKKGLMWKISQLS